LNTAVVIPGPNKAATRFSSIERIGNFRESYKYPFIFIIGGFPFFLIYLLGSPGGRWFQGNNSIDNVRMKGMMHNALTIGISGEYINMAGYSGKYLWPHGPDL
jgi:hypothetical protein